MKKNLLTILLAGCGLLCAQAGWGAGKAKAPPLPSKAVFAPKKPMTFSMRIETSSEDAAYSCNRLLKFYMVDYTGSGKTGKSGPPWTFEMSKEYEPPFTEPDKLVRALRGTPCGTSGDFTWTVSQGMTIHETASVKKP